MAGPLGPDARLLALRRLAWGTPVWMPQFYRFGLSIGAEIRAGVFPLALPPTPPPARTTLGIGCWRVIRHQQVIFGRSRSIRWGGDLGVERRVRSFRELFILIAVLLRLLGGTNSSRRRIPITDGK